MIFLLSFISFFVSIFISVFYLQEAYVDYKEKTKLGKSNLEKLMEKQMALINKNKKAREILPKINNMLKVSSFKINGEPVSIILFLIVSISTGAIGLSIGVLFLNNPVAGLILAVMTFIGPYYVLSIDYSKNRSKMRRQTSNFLLAVANLFNVYEDPIIALEELVPKLENPLKREVGWFVDSMTFGAPLDISIEKIKERLPDKILKDFFEDVRFYLKNGGDFQESVLLLVKETYARETAEIEKGAKISSTITIFFLLIGVYFFMAFALFKNQPEIMSFLVDTTMGKVLVVVMLIVFIVASYFTKVMVSSGDGDE